VGAFFAFLVIAAVVIVLATVFLVGVSLGELAPLVAIGGTVGYVAVIVGFWMVFAFLAEALAGLAIGRTIMRDEGLGARIGALILGLILVGLLLSLPYLNGLIGFLVLTFGIGAICLRLIGQTPANTAFGPAPPAKPMAATVL
jgi:hypothetical protein